ncbi:MAG: flagellar biosynthetic protein FliO [Hoeflea sp.]|uniref:flagellar biosynthetic protein FliO n=1 Tax=Hoeflea sp. TaxID=1940281 RepID=UPI0032EBB3A5
MPDDILGGQGATLLMAIVIVAIALLALVAVFWLIRKRSSSTFIRGGRARQPRLAVLDAAAVDTRRRIVLIRRDDVEHLVMIGGPTDVVIESRIVQPGEPDATHPRPSRATAEPQARAEPAAPEPASPRPVSARQSGSDQALWEEPARVQPKPAASAPAAPVARDRPAATQSPLSPVSYGATAGSLATATAIKADPRAEAEAADILESARSRVFEEQPPAREPDAAGAQQSPPQPEEAPRDAAQNPANQQAPAYQQANAQPVESPQVAAAPEPRSAAPAGYDEILSDEEFGSEDWDIGDPFEEQPATLQTGPQTVPPPPQQTSAPAEPGLDFESVLAAELSDDLAGDPFDEDPAGDTAAAEPAPSEPEPAPEVQAETKPSRDTLEAEMERLLGELSKKS